MKINKPIVLKFLALIILIVTIAFTVISQIAVPDNVSPNAELYTSSKISRINDHLILEEKNICKNVFYDEVQEIYGTCTYYYNYTVCFNSSGPNTDCSLNQIQYNFSCKTGDLIIKKNLTECKPLNKFVVSINKGSVTEKKEIDFSNWGVCINSTENDCLAITCGSQHGGSAVNGVFNGCDGGKSCQKFLFCKEGTNVLFKASREDFVEEDPTFHLSKLALKDVGQ